MVDTDLPQGARFQQRYDEAVKTLETAMSGYLTPRETTIPEILREAMNYSLQSGGKRLRPVMVIMACEACNGSEINALPAAAAIEMVHTYSLIHDDLPAMDDDDLRRGRPTSHKVFGDGIAILAGDALLTFAFQVIAQHVQKPELVKELVVELATAAGAPGMISGQVEDLVNSDPTTRGDIDTVTYIHTRKTAMMFRAALRMGGLCADADANLIDLLGDYGLKLGLAFQIVDDLLDITATAGEMGKRTQKDAQAGKLTYPAVMGIEQSRRHADQLIEEALKALEPLGADADLLRALAQKVINRTN